MSVVYNEHDPHAAEWLHHLIEEGQIAHGDVDTRSIRDVDAQDYHGYAQVHLFAGIGIWSAAARLAGWPDDRRVGTISCPCQPFSAAGKGLGFADPRHLWPDACRIVRELRLDVLFGEQAPTAGAWIDLVATDLEGLGYAFGAPVIPAAGFGGAHIRQRFYWVADANNAQWWSDRAPRHERDWPQAGRVEGAGDVGVGGSDGRMAHSAVERHERRGTSRNGWARPANDGSAGGLADADGWIASNIDGQPGGQYRKLARNGASADWLACRDAKWRPVESGTFPLAYEDPGRVGRLRAYGNALDLETAANFIGAYLDVAPAIPRIVA